MIEFWYAFDIALAVLGPAILVLNYFLDGSAAHPAPEPQPAVVRHAPTWRWLAVFVAALAVLEPALVVYAVPALVASFPQWSAHVTQLTIAALAWPPVWFVMVALAGGARGKHWLRLYLLAPITCPSLIYMSIWTVSCMNALTCPGPHL